MEITNLNSTDNQEFEETSAFVPFFTNNTNSNFVINNEDASLTNESVDVNDDFEMFLSSLRKNVDEPDLRELMINELKRQGISDPTIFLGNGGLDITMRLSK